MKVKYEFERDDHVIIILNESHLEPKDMLHEGIVVKQRTGVIFKNNPFGYVVRSHNGNEFWSTALMDYILPYDEEKFKLLSAIFEQWQTHYVNIDNIKKQIRKLI